MTDQGKAERDRAKALRLAHQALAALDKADEEIFAMAAPSRGRRSVYPVAHAHEIAAASLSFRNLANAILQALGEPDTSGISDPLQLMRLDLEEAERSSKQGKVRKRSGRGRGGLK